jgi:oligoendopeptidase F
MSLKFEKGKRKYIAEDFKAESWEELEIELQKLLSQEINSQEDLINLIEASGELNDILEEIGAWKQIRMTQFADNPQYAKEQSDFYENVVAPGHKHFFELDKKIFENDFFAQLPQERYSHLGLILKNEIELFREENTPLFVEENKLSSKFGEMYSQLTVSFEGEEKTLDAMSVFLLEEDREIREKAWRIVANKMLEKRDGFEKLFDDLKELRIQIAKNAGFANYRDYMHKAYGRFDYTPEDLYEFHESVRSVVVPVLVKITERRKKVLKVESLRPWDTEVSLGGKKLKPFEKFEELLSGSIEILEKIDPEFARVLSMMKESGFLDLENRKGKAPGGYSCTLKETKANFIFMNAVGSQRDVQTLLHESGHAFHSIAKSKETISEYKNTPMEVAELASMSMELISMEYWDGFYKDNRDFYIAKKEQLEDTLYILPIAMVIDSFQHWIYLNPSHSAEERNKKFAEIKKSFGSGVDWSQLEKELEVGWLRVLHVFEAPFYYIEYAISQLGAIALWKSYKENPENAIACYKKFMKLGYSKSVPEIYAAAGIKFDFSKEYLEEMIDFVMGELEKLED